MDGAGSREILRFGDFELDVGAYELRRGGVAVRVERQPMDLLLLLVQRRGELVSRADIIDRLWGRDVFVDVETGIHTAARRIRQALGDSAVTPTYLESSGGGNSSILVFSSLLVPCVLFHDSLLFAST